MQQRRSRNLPRGTSIEGDWMGLIRTNTLGIRVDSIGDDGASRLLSDLTDAQRPVLFTFVNPASISAAKRNPRYPHWVDQFDAVLPDGIGMCWAIRLLHRLPAARVSFDSTSLAPEVFQWACRNGLTVALVGGRPGVSQRAADNLREAFPGLRIAAVFDGYGDPATKVGELRRLAPSIVICGMGVGAQERFLLDLAAAGWSGAGFTCGGYLDQLAGGLRYYPAWIDAANLRWAYRLARGPRRLARRYLVDYAYFAALLGRALLSQPQNADRREGPLAEELTTFGAGIDRQVKSLRSPD